MSKPALVKNNIALLLVITCCRCQTHRIVSLKEVTLFPIPISRRRIVNWRGWTEGRRPNVNIWCNSLRRIIQTSALLESSKTSRGIKGFYHSVPCLYNSIKNSIINELFKFGPSPELSLTAIQSLCDFLETSFHWIRCWTALPRSFVWLSPLLIIKRIRDEFLKNGNKTYMIEKCVRDVIR